MHLDYNIILDLIIGLCSGSLITSVIIDFILYQSNDSNNKKKSKVATGNMSLFFFVLYILWGTKIGMIDIKGNLEMYINIFGIIIVIISTLFNIIGRFYLSTNWANHIKIYENHFLVNTGPYRIVRHPLYASLIWLGIGVGLVYCNYLMIILTLAIFLPMMIYRAKQEEELLQQRFPNYKEYKEKVGMFLPKIF